MPQLRDGTHNTDPRLDRMVHFDPRSRNFPITAVLSATQQQPVSRRWTIPQGSPVLDQGNEGACVGFGVTNELRFRPVPIPDLDARFAHDTIYWGAQRADNWPGGSYPGATPVYEGTSVLAGMKTATKLGYYGEYRWALSEAELALGVSYVGPSVIGVNWYQGMFRPDPQGFLPVTGAKAGGHCLLVAGINVAGDYYVLYNSWGPGWGQNGTAKLRRPDMARLQAEQGEAAIITQRLAPAASTH